MVGARWEATVGGTRSRGGTMVSLGDAAVAAAVTGVVGGIAATAGGNFWATIGGKILGNGCT